MLVPVRSRPHGLQGSHVGEIECADRRLPDVCVDMTRQAAKPSVVRVHRLGHGRKITALNDFLDEAKLFGRDVGILVPYRDRRSEEHTSELQSLMRISYAVFCLKKKNNNNKAKYIIEYTTIK